MRRNFDRELTDLNQELLKMAKTVLAAFQQAMTSLQTRDLETLEAVVAGDKAVNAMEKELETRCLHLLMKQQPVVAADLRAVSAALKLTTDLERLGDQAQDIADIGAAFCRAGRNPMGVACCLGEMADQTLWMLQNAVQALEEENMALAKEVSDRDDRVDALFEQLKRELVEAIKAERANPDDILDLMMMGKYLERIGDHSVNVCEWVEFYQTGRHQEAQIL